MKANIIKITNVILLHYNVNFDKVFIFGKRYIHCCCLIIREKIMQFSLICTGNILESKMKTRIGEGNNFFMNIYAR